jgi:hypothetical protein
VAARIATVVTAIIAVALPSNAFAWSQTYSYETTFGAGGFNYSSWQSSLSYNEVTFSTPPPPGDMRTTLCDTGGSCYAYLPAYGDGLGQDFRQISYGKAKCNAYLYSIYVHHCYTDNLT